MTKLGDIISETSQNARNIVRNIEKTQKKVITAKNAVVFHQTCISNDILPKFTDIRLHNPAVRRHQITLDFRKKLVEEQLKEREERVRELEAELKVLRAKLISEKVDKDTLEQIYRALYEEYTYFNDVVKGRITKKLSKL